MKAAMLAIVLLIASVIVLIFANTLNSWVLGGLIGGLAALLISIPISLLIFTSLARRHDERLFAQMAEQEEAERSQYEGEAYADAYETEAYVMPQEDEGYEREEAYYEDEQQYEYEDARYYREPEGRNIPSPGQVRRYGGEARPSQASQKNPQTGHQRLPRTPQTTRSLRSMQHAAALRAAMREAEQDRFDQDGTASRRRVTPRNQLEPKARPRRSESGYYQPASRDLPSQRTMPYRSDDTTRRSQRTGDLRTPRRQEEQSNYQPVTGPMRWNPETDKIGRNAQPDDEPTRPESWTGALNTPMVRRAPYLYEDDPLREHFAQQVDKPITRRSSRHLQSQEE